MNNAFKNQKGATAIFLTLLILSVMLFVALTSSDIIQNGLQMSRAHFNSTKAYYGAESGAERILWEIRKHGIDPPNDIAPNDWSDGECVNFTAENSGGIAVPRTNTCYLNSVGNYTHQILGNQVNYWIKYGWDGTTVSMECTGNYKNITQRMVEITYVD